MIWRLNRNLFPVLTLVLGLATTDGSHAADAPEPDLLKHSQQLTTFRTGDVHWAACLPSGDTALFLRVTDSYEFAFTKRDLNAGIDTPLRALKELYRSNLGYGYTISPDGNWLLWKNGQNETWWSTLDGQRHGKRNGNISNKIFWMADSRHWVEFVNTQVFQYTRAHINDIIIPGKSQLVNLRPQSPLTHSNFRLPPGDLDNALFTQSGSLLVACQSEGHELNVEILELDVKRQGMPTHQFTVQFPGDVGLSALAFSQDGEHIAWLLFHGKLLLCVSRLDGSDMHLIGALTITTRNPNNPDDMLNAEPTALQWGSDGKSLTYLYRDTLYRVPASDSAVNAPIPPYLSVATVGISAPERSLTGLLMKAIYRADQEAVKRLIADGAQVNYQNSEGDTPLMVVSELGRTESVKTLLAVGANLNLRDRWGNTALIKAIEANQDETALLLLANGAQVNVKGYYNRTALLVETRKGPDPGRRGNPKGTTEVVRQPSLNLITALLSSRTQFVRRNS